MDKFIQEIVAIDRQYAKKVEDAKQKKSDVQSNMNAKKKEIYNAFMAEQQKIIAEHKASLQAEIQATKTQNEEEFKASLASLQNLYETQKDNWVESIVNHCKEI